MKVELLWWEGCPGWPDTLELLRETLSDLEADPEGVELREIVSEEQARREGFPGSPTIRVNGSDVLPPEQPAPAGLTCRVYRLRDGRPSPAPDADDLREALERSIR